MSSNPNWIVGENLIDFLSLGLTSGYFALRGRTWTSVCDSSTNGSQAR